MQLALKGARAKLNFSLILRNAENIVALYHHEIPYFSIPVNLEQWNTLKNAEALWQVKILLVNGRSLPISPLK